MLAVAPLAKVLALLNNRLGIGLAEHGHTKHVVAVLHKAQLLVLRVALVQEDLFPFYMCAPVSYVCNTKRESTLLSAH